MVHPVRQHRPHLPSRFPYLPLTPQELLRAYLGIVGVAPHDSYGVQVTYDKQLDLLGRTSTSSHVRKTTGGDELPCADGKPRVRMHGGAHVVLAYRDSPAYAEGRTALGRLRGRRSCRPTSRSGTEPRRPVPAREYGMGKLERRANRVADAVSFFDPDTSNDPGPPAAALLLAAGRRMTTFALVHGAWHGAWCWERLLEPLAQRGHGAVAIDLPAEDLEAGLDAYADIVAAFTRAGGRRRDRRRALAQRADPAARRRAPAGGGARLPVRAGATRGARASATSSPTRRCRS